LLFRIFQRDILNFLSLTDKCFAHAGDLFNFKKEIKAPTASIPQIIWECPSSLQRKTTYCSASSFSLCTNGKISKPFTSDEPHFVRELIERVYPAIISTPTASELPETRVFSRPVIAYMAAFLPVAPLFKASDTMITGICDDQYAATLEMLQEMEDKKFKKILDPQTQRKVQGWFRRWSIQRKANCASSSDAGGDASYSISGSAAAVAAARQHPRRMCRRHPCLTLRMRMAENRLFQMVQVVPVQAPIECL
jgi:hypothetical protein